MRMLAAAGDILSWALGAGALVGGLGYAAGQFVSSRRRALSDSLSTALNEVTAYQNKTNRLESELSEVKTEMQQLRNANQVLQQSIASGVHIAPAIEAAMSAIRVELATIAEREHEKTRALIREKLP